MHVLCEACGTETEDWLLSKGNTLAVCPNCKNIQRDMKRCPANAREHAWGGISAFDKIRLSLTYESLKSHFIGRLRRNPEAILDIGFGAGILLNKFIDMGIESHGIEADLLEVPFAEKLKEKATLYFGNAENIQFPDNHFDLIYAIHVIEHVLDPKLVFDKCYKSLKPGGMVYFITPNAESLGLKWFKDKWWNLEDPTHIRFFSKESTKLMLANTGFTNIEINIPRWDSLTLEANSFNRFLMASHKHGVSSNIIGRSLSLLTLPLYLLLRVLNPRISPSIEIIASKES